MTLQLEGFLGDISNQLRGSRSEHQLLTLKCLQELGLCTQQDGLKRVFPMLMEVGHVLLTINNPYPSPLKAVARGNLFMGLHSYPQPRSVQCLLACGVYFIPRVRIKRILQIPQLMSLVCRWSRCRFFVFARRGFYIHRSCTCRKFSAYQLPTWPQRAGDHRVSFWRWCDYGSLHFEGTLPR